MSANVETMFSTREKPWHGLGTIIMEAPTSEEALKVAGLDWNVVQRDVYTDDNIFVPGYKVNVRDKDGLPLGIVTDKYKIVQNQEAFKFTDDLLGEGVRYETAGALQNGRRVWILAKMPENYIIAGDKIEPYFLITNSHDGSSGIKACMTPIRVVCNNTLNLALDRAKRIWTTKHTENIMSRMNEAQETLFMADTYMIELGKEIDSLNKIKISDQKVMQYISEFFPITEDMTSVQKKNNLKLLNDMKMRYFDAPDLLDVGKNAYRWKERNLLMSMVVWEAKALMDNDFKFIEPRISSTIKNKWRYMNEDPIRTFLRERVEIYDTGNSFIATADLHKAFIQDSGMEEMPLNVFSKKISEYSLKKLIKGKGIGSDGNRVNGFLNIELKSLDEC